MAGSFLFQLKVQSNGEAQLEKLEGGIDKVATSASKANKNTKEWKESLNRVAHDAVQQLEPVRRVIEEVQNDLAKGGPTKLLPTGATGSVVAEMDRLTAKSTTAFRTLQAELDRLTNRFNRGTISDSAFVDSVERTMQKASIAVESYMSDSQKLYDKYNRDMAAANEEAARKELAGLQRVSDARAAEETKSLAMSQRAATLDRLEKETIEYAASLEKVPAKLQNIIDKMYKLKAMQSLKTPEALDRDLKSLSVDLEIFKRKPAQAVSSDIETVAESIDRLDKNVEKVSKKSNSFSWLASLKWSIMSQSVGAFINEVQEATQVVTEFDAALHALRGVAGASVSQTAEFSSVARDIAANTEHSASTVAQLGLEFTKAGYSASQVTKLLGDATDLLTASGTTQEQVVNTMVATMNSFNLTAEESARVVNVIQSTVSGTILSFEDYAEAMKMVAPIAKQYGLSLEETSTYIGKIGDMGLRGTLGGTALKNILQALVDPTKEASKVLGRFNLEGKSLMEILKEVNAGTTSNEFADVFNLRALGPALNLTTEQVSNLFDKLKVELENQTVTAKSAAEEMRKGIGNQFKDLGTEIQNLMVNAQQAWDTVLPDSAGPIQAITEELKNLSFDLRVNPEKYKELFEVIQGIGDLVAGIIRSVSDLASNAGGATAVINGLAKALLFKGAIDTVTGIRKGLTATSEEAAVAATGVEKVTRSMLALKLSWGGVATAAVAAGAIVLQMLEDWDRRVNNTMRSFKTLEKSELEKQVSMYREIIGELSALDEKNKSSLSAKDGEGGMFDLLQNRVVTVGEARKLLGEMAKKWDYDATTLFGDLKQYQGVVHGVSQDWIDLGKLIEVITAKASQATKKLYTPTDILPEVEGGEGKTKGIKNDTSKPKKAKEKGPDYSRAKRVAQGGFYPYQLEGYAESLVSSYTSEVRAVAKSLGLSLETEFEKGGVFDYVKKNNRFQEILSYEWVDKTKIFAGYDEAQKQLLSGVLSDIEAVQSAVAQMVSEMTEAEGAGAVRWVDDIGDNLVSVAEKAAASTEEITKLKKQLQATKDEAGAKAMSFNVTAFEGRKEANPYFVSTIQSVIQLRRETRETVSDLAKLGVSLETISEGQKLASEAAFGAVTTSLNDTMQLLASGIGSALSVVQDYYNIQEQFLNAAHERQMGRLQAEKEYAVNMAGENVRRKMLLEMDYYSKIAAEKRKQEKESMRLARKQQNLQAALATMDTLVATTSALAGTPGPAWVKIAAAATVFGAGMAKVAMLKATPLNFAFGSDSVERHRFDGNSDLIPAMLSAKEMVITRDRVEAAGGSGGINRAIDQAVSSSRSSTGQGNTYIFQGQVIGQEKYVRAMIDQIDKERSRRYG